MTNLRRISPLDDEFALSCNVLLPPRLVHERGNVLHCSQSPRNDVVLHLLRIVHQLRQEHWVPAYPLYRFDEEVAQSEPGDCGVSLNGRIVTENVCRMPASMGGRRLLDCSRCDDSTSFLVHIPFPTVLHSSDRIEGFRVTGAE